MLSVLRMATHVTFWGWFQVYKWRLTGSVQSPYHFTEGIWAFPDLGIKTEGFPELIPCGYWEPTVLWMRMPEHELISDSSIKHIIKTATTKAGKIMPLLLWKCFQCCCHRIRAHSLQDDGSSSARPSWACPSHPHLPTCVLTVRSHTRGLHIHAAQSAFLSHLPQPS